MTVAPKLHSERKKAAKARFDKAREDFKKASEEIKNDPNFLAGLSGFLILSGATIVEAIVLFANLSPYMKAANILITKSLGLGILTSFFIKPIGWIVGIAGLTAIQFAEIRPYLLKTKDLQRLKRANNVALVAYVIDCSLAILFWSPLKVSLSEFIQAPLPSSVYWLHLVIILITVFGGEWLIKLRRELR